MQISRRGFLKLLSATAATAAVPVPVFSLASPLEVIPSLPVFLGNIRALAYCDLYKDCWIVRMDAFNGTDQFGVDFMVGGEPTRESYLWNRKIAEEVLSAHLKHHKWMASDLIALPIPRGYVEPDWMRA